MLVASENLNFERAQEYMDQKEHIEAVMEQQKVVLSDRRVNIDIFGYSFNKGWMCIQVFYVRQGKLVERDATIFPFFNEAKDAFISFIGQFYKDQRNIKTKQIIVPIEKDNNLLDRKSTRM